jgi:hypothetical protein
MIQQCIEILEAETESAQFTTLQALRWLPHLMEDLHQPLHVVSGYYSTAADSLTHPKRIAAAWGQRAPHCPIQSFRTVQASQRSHGRTGAGSAETRPVDARHRHPFLVAFWL